MKRYLMYIIFLVFCLVGCKKTEVSGGNKFFIDNNLLYYTSKSGDLYSYSLKDKSTEKILDDFPLKACNEKYFIGYSEGIIKIYNRYNEKLSEIKNINLNSVDILDDIIYYSNVDDNNYIYSININNDMKNDIFLQESTKKLSVNKDYIFYEKDDNFIYSYNFISSNSEKLFEGQYCLFFCCDDKNVYLSDYLNNNTILEINIDTKKINKLYDIATVEFSINKRKLYYIPFIDENYYNKNIKYHIYEFDNIKNKGTVLL